MGAPGRSRAEVHAWRPALPGIAEVLHASFDEHAYPAHTHDTWTLMVLDRGAVRYDLDRRERGIVPHDLTLLPPHVAHDGRNGTAAGFVKRVLYLEEGTIPGALVGRAVDRPAVHDGALRAQVVGLHRALGADGDAAEAADRFAVVLESLRARLGSRQDALPSPRSEHATALRDLLDADVAAGVRLEDAAATIGVSRGHLVRSFAATFGIPPHRYLTGRRLDLARRLLLDGRAPADVAAEVGFTDQSHLHRHLVRLLGTTPAQYAGGRGRVSRRGRAGRSPAPR